MTAADRLNEIEARHIAWHDSLPNIAKWSDLHGALSSTAGATADELAMAWELARNDVPALVAALRAVLDLHREGGYEVNGVFYRTECRACMQFDCPTVRAIEEALS